MMIQKIVTLFVAFIMTISLTACGVGEETTLTGVVVSVEGTVLSLVEMDAGNMGDKNFAEGERPELPEDMEGFQGFGDFNPEEFEGEFPQGENIPQWGEGERPELPEGMTPPEGMNKPEDGDRPDFSGESGGMRPDFGNVDADVETKRLDVRDAHISVEIDGGKAGGSMDDIKQGTFVTITVNGKGQVTNVLVSSKSFFGSGGRKTQSR